VLNLILTGIVKLVEARMGGTRTVAA